MQHDNENKEYHHQTDSKVECEVIDGLAAAKQYERDRTRLPLSFQEEMIKDNFRQVPDGDVSKRLTEDEYTQLRASIQNNASKRAADCIANLREQMMEYHSLLDQLSSMTAKYESMQKISQASEERIHQLEQEVVNLKKEQHHHAPVLCRTGDIPRRVSYPGGHCGVHQPTQFSPQVPIMQMQQIPNWAFCQPRASFMNHLVPIPFCSVNDSLNQHQVAQNPFCDMNELLQARRHGSPSPSSHRLGFPTAMSALNPTAGNFSSKQGVGGLQPIPTKRTFANVPNHPQGAKRLKTDAFPAPSSIMGQFYFPEAAYKQ